MSRSTAVVIGAGMGGLAAARVLSEHFDQVRISERDQWSIRCRRIPIGCHTDGVAP